MQTEDSPEAATFVGVGINVLQQVSGINVFIYFAEQILDDAGLGHYAMLSAAIVSGIQLAATAALIRYIDKLGRRPLAATGIVGMLVGLMLIVVGSLLRGAGALLSVTAWFALSSMLIYRAAFSLSLGPLPYVMTSEFFAQEARAAGVGFCWAMNWLSNFGVSLCFKVLVKALPGPYGQAIIFGT
ncbi:Facilitated trehalose transporter Tret1 [Durusdinium trenchii]|uniref:Hexose transporter 1 n=1 Tax=Durusdinium trenchii TaxID=1381693 RepID=A0ABP0KB43_9DINO